MGPRPAAYSGGARSRGEIDSRWGRVRAGRFWARATRSWGRDYWDGWPDEDLIQANGIVLYGLEIGGQKKKRQTEILSLYI